MLRNTFQNASPSQLVDAMAEAMRRRGDGCTAADLKLAGFNEAQIAAYGDRACEKATAMSTISTVARIRAPSRSPENRAA